MRLPSHEPCGTNGIGEHTGERMDFKCVAVRTFSEMGRDPEGHVLYRHDDKPGCGGISSLCPKCGNRTVFNGSVCAWCRGDHANEGSLR